MHFSKLLLILILSLSSITYAEDEILDEDLVTTGEEELEEEQAFKEPSNSLETNIPSNKKEFPEVESKTAQIIALNKITAKSQEIKLNKGESKYFGNIEIKVHKCIKNPDPYEPDNKILLTITEYKIDEDPAIIFQGWLFSSNLSISTLEHPVYEIFAKNCL